MFVIHKSTVALCLRLCLFFHTFYRKYAYSCYAYKKKLLYYVIKNGGRGLLKMLMLDYREAGGVSGYDDISKLKN